MMLQSLTVKWMRRVPSNAVIRLIMTGLIHARFYRGSHRITKHCFMNYFFGVMVLAECDISPCKHRIHHVIEAMLRITYVTLLVNALFWSTLWSTQQKSSGNGIDLQMLIVISKE